MTIAEPLTLLSAVITIFAILICIYTGLNVARARAKYGVVAPSMTGHPVFERAMRVQMNTVEQFVIFLPALWLSAIYFRSLGWITPILGLVWCMGRIIYAIGYMADPKKRHVGFAITMIALCLLLILAAIGIVSDYAITTFT